MIRQTVAALTQPTTRAPRTQWLVHPRLTPGARGLVAVEVLRNGVASTPHHLPNAESATLLLAGKGTWIGADELVLGPGEGVFNPPATWRGLTPEGNEATVLLTVYGGADLEMAPVTLIGAPDADECGCHIAPPVEDCSTDDAGVLGTVGGSVDMGVRWLATTDTVGSRSLVVATSTFVPGGSHELHRHQHADEFFLVLSGTGEHLTQDGPVRLAPGDLAFIPAGEWHGFRTDPGITTRTVYGYLGAGSLAKAGYDLRGGGAQ
ncbi:MAG: cupin domain-containing protein [Pseudonocardiales bacterium]